MNHITFHFELDTVMVVVVMNVILTGLHLFLFKLYQSKKWKWSNAALSVVDFGLSMLSWVMANKPHPPSSEVTEIKK